MKVSLDRLEARLQALIEGSAARLFPAGVNHPGLGGTGLLAKDLSSQLVEAMRGNLRASSDGSLWAPNLFMLVAHPEQAGLLGQNQALLDDLARSIQQAAEGDVHFPSPPAIQVVPDPRLGLHEVQIQASFHLDRLADTTSLEGKLEKLDGDPLPGGFLIIDGERVFSIEKPVINIGRSSRNDLVLQDPRISREHAQLRLIHGRFVIFDLDSTGGTFVNGQRVIQAPLYPGDMISLAGVSIIFNQDLPSSAGETLPFPHE